MANLLDRFFQSNNQQQQQQQQTPPNGQQQQQAGDKPLSAPNPTTDATGQMPGTQQIQKSPLDVYSEMFQNASKVDAPTAPVLALKNEDLSKIASGIDFMSGVDQTLMEKAMGGDAKSMLELLQATSRNVYTLAMEHNAAVTNQHLTQRSDYERTQITSGVQKELRSQALSTAPNYNHPQVRAELNRIADQLAAANPTASPQEIAESAQDYLKQVHEALFPAEDKSKDKGSEGPVDWAKYLE